jgi:two-component system nitrogen regulation sensor histidine kinase NtrY
MTRLLAAVSDYHALELRHSGIQITFTLLYVTVALMLLFAAVWMGLVFANRIMRPISALVGATERVRAGDLTVRVVEEEAGDEISALSRAFNRMAGQLESQRAELVEANRQLDNRRRFTEAVLFGVSAGVLGLDRDGHIFLPNRSALDLLACRPQDLIGRRLEDAVPEMGELMDSLRTGDHDLIQGKVSVVREDRARELLVRIGVQGGEGRVGGYVVTFDDVTELVYAQRAAAWTDVARRIAHEIKNPLTPIQLSAERLRRKYRQHIEGDEVFASCVETIIRQVGAIRGMVDEFSAFARMPAPVLVEENLVAIVKGAVSMQRTAHPEIEFATAYPEGPVNIHCDARQVGQAMTNLLQNAIDAIDGREAARQGEPAAGRIAVRIDPGGPDSLTVSVEDNGRGLPPDPTQRAMLTEPYVTTRERGTGLGLAIVKKIMEDHGGRVVLSDGAVSGAVASLVFPVRSASAAGETRDRVKATQGDGQ